MRQARTETEKKLSRALTEMLIRAFEMRVAYMRFELRINEVTKRVNFKSGR